MPIAFKDLARRSLEPLFAPEPLEAYRRWMDAQDPDVLAGLAALGVFAHHDHFERGLATVTSHRDQVAALVADNSWRQAIDAGIQATLSVLDHPLPDVRLYALVGPNLSNASAAMWDGRGIAFIWLENWLGPGATKGLQDCDVATLAAATTHELAHGLRHGLTGTQSPLARVELRQPVDLWEARLALPLREVMYDEGLAGRFALDAVPGTSVADALMVSADQVAWFDENWERLLGDRELRWDLDQPPSPEKATEALYYVPERMRPPWSIQRPPSKWGYYVGMKWAEGARGDWAVRLASAAPVPNRRDPVPDS